MTDTKNVRVTHSFKVPADKVFDAWLNPDQAGKWLFATDKGEMVRVEIDARVGGTFRFVDRRNGEDVEHVGEYVTIDRPHRLVFDFAVPQYSPEKTRVAIDIEAQGTGCILGLTHEGVPPDYVERTHAGWAKILDGLNASLSPLH
ncbi:MAG: hypothetical protein JWL63_3537 [Rhodocyclales bacterium]|nr:hypothetical protein [Rhodocyclales bacterium]